MRLVKQVKSIFLISIFFGVIIQASAQNISTNVTAWAETTDAYYADLDFDGFPDDIRIEMKVSIFNANPSQLLNGLPYWIDLKIILPSGYLYWYLVSDYGTQQTFFLMFNFYNHATESGWYTIEASAFTEQVENTIPTHRYLFDPPGGLPGGDPTVMAWKP